MRWGWPWPPPFPPDVAARADLDLQFVAPVFVGETIHAGGERRDEGVGKYYVWIKAGDRLVVRGTLRARHEAARDPSARR